MANLGYSISNRGYGYAVNDLFTQNLWDIVHNRPAVFRVTSVSTYPTKILVVKGGYGYRSVDVMLYDGVTSKNFQGVVRNTILVDVIYDPEDINFPANNLFDALTTVAYVNGSGAYGEFNVVSGLIDTYSITDSGLNYSNDRSNKVEIYSDIAMTNRLHVYVEYAFGVDYGGIRGINSIDLEDGYVLDLVDGTYYFKVVEEFGSGAEAHVVSGAMFDYTIMDIGSIPDLTEPNFWNIGPSVHSTGSDFEMYDPKYNPPVGVPDLPELPYPITSGQGATFNLIFEAEGTVDIVRADQPLPKSIQETWLHPTGYINPVATMTGNGTGAVLQSDCPGPDVVDIVEPGWGYVSIPDCPYYGHGGGG